MKETAILKSIQVALSNIGARMFRNNNGALQNIHGQWVTYGLGVGTSDLIGFIPVVITEAMIGKTVSLFCAIEVKTKKGVHSKEQLAFIHTVQQAGGIAFIARSEQSAVDGVRVMVGML